MAAAQAGQADAQYALGLRYFNGDEVAENYAESAAWFERAADQGHAQAQNHLGRYYHAGLGVEQDREQALHWLEAATQSGAPSHLHDLAKVLESEEATQSRAAELYARAADVGHVESAVSLGVLYQNGHGVEQDYGRAISLYLEPAQAGHPRAMNNLGLMYVRGTGVAQDYSRAATLFEAAAEAGLHTAMTNLGVLYENGYGIPMDEERAVELYRMGGNAPDAGQSAPVQLVYDARLNAVGSSPDGLKAIQAMAKAGDPIAQFQMGWILMQTSNADFATQQQAVRLFRRGAEIGHGPSMANLGIMYFQGRGLPVDYVLGHMWLLRAKETGVSQASDFVAEFSVKMTASQVNESQSRAQSRFD